MPRMIVYNYTRRLLYSCRELANIGRKRLQELSDSIRIIKTCRVKIGGV